MKHIKLDTINLKNHPTLNEKWIQEVIAGDPSILGIGDVILKDKERNHIGAGRLDLLLQDAEGGRYEVEIQLGATDPSHIIRTIEYWDIEKKRYPQYDHTAVIVAEDITSRFFNVVSLFNGFIPLMAIQVSAIKIHDNEIGLKFTKILDTVTFGYDDEETSDPTDRTYWENKGTKETVALADKILEIAKKFVPVEFSYNKSYMGFWLDGRACNFAICRPQKNALRLEIPLPRTEATDELIRQAEFDSIEYNKRWGRYRLTITNKDISEKSESLEFLLKQAHELRN